MSKTIVKLNVEQLKKKLGIEAPLSLEEIMKHMPKHDLTQYASTTDVERILEKIEELQEIIDELKERKTTQERVFVGSTRGDLQILSPSETPDGIITAFTFNKKPTMLVVNGGSYRINKGWSWSATNKQATIDFAPLEGSDVYGVIVY